MTSIPVPAQWFAALLMALATAIAQPAYAAKDPAQIADKAISQMQKAFDKGVAKGGKTYDKLERKVLKMVDKPVFRRTPYYVEGDKAIVKILQTRDKTIAKLESTRDKAIQKLQRTGASQTQINRVLQEAQNLISDGDDLVDDTIDDINEGIEDAFDYLGI